MNARAQGQVQFSSPSFTPAPMNVVQRKCTCGGSAGLSGECAECRKEKLVGKNSPLIQPKLKISQPNDKYEQEADRVADEVMRMPEPRIQRRVEPEEKEEDKTLQMKPISTRITPLVQRKTIDKEEEDEQEPSSYIGGMKLPLLPSRQQEIQHEDIADEIPVHLGTVSLTGLPPAPPESRSYIGPTAVPWPEERQARDSLRPELDPTAYRRLFPWWLHPPRRRDHKSVLALLQDVCDKSLSRIALKWSVNPTLLKKLVRSGVKVAGKKALKAAIREIAPNPDIEEGLKKDLDSLWNRLRELEEKLDLRSKNEAKIKKKEEVLQRKVLAKRTDGPGSDSPGADSPEHHSAVPAGVQHLSQSGSRPLDPSVRMFMESQLRHDFGQVRIHTDSRAVAMARAVNARAFTVGHDIAFGAGEYKPSTKEGLRLVAHELVHTVQQTAQETSIAPALFLQRRARTPEMQRQDLNINHGSLRFIPKGDPIVGLEESPEIGFVTFNNGPHLEMKAKRLEASSAVMTRGDDDSELSDWDIGFHQTIQRNTDLILCYSRPDPNVDPRGSAAALEPETGMMTQNIGELAGGPLLDGDVGDQAPFINPPKMARSPSPIAGVTVSMSDRPQATIPIFLNNDPDRGACLTRAIRVFHATAFVVAHRNSDDRTIYVNHVDWGFRQSMYPGAIALRDSQQMDFSNIGNYSMHYAAFPFRIGVGKGLFPSVLTPPFANTFGKKTKAKKVSEPCPSTGIGCIPDPRPKRGNAGAVHSAQGSFEV